MRADALSQGQWPGETPECLPESLRILLDALVPTGLSLSSRKQIHPQDTQFLTAGLLCPLSGFYTGWLLPAAVVGTVVFLVGCFLVFSDIPT